MEDSKNIWGFYQTIVNLIQKDFTSANKFVEQATTTMIFVYQLDKIDQF